LLCGVSKPHSLITREDLAIKIGQRIREIREKKGISLKQFENYEDSLERSNMSQIENGVIMPTVFTLYKIAQILGVKVSDFIKE
jgi:transcriptional regulator with XRE-family HTH domain